MSSELGPGLATALLGGAWSERAMVERARRAVHPRPPWVLPLVREVRAAYHRPPLDRPRELARFVEVVLRRLHDPRVSPSRVRVWRPVPERMLAVRWPVPVIHTAADLAELLELDPGQLAWLADVRGLEPRAAAERLRNYRYGWAPRRSGLPRVIERPKRRLKEIQRWILHAILDHVPAHPAAHGFVPGRSALTHARAHVGREVVLGWDLTDFFAAVTAGRVFGLLRTAGYPEGVAHLLTGLTTNVVPREEWERVPRPVEPRALFAHAALGRALATPHLPQGAPTSPALANLSAFRLDRRLEGLVACFDASYTRYADDLVVSGGRRLHAGAPVLRRAVAEIVADEGFRLHEAKSRLVTRAGRQRVTGIVVNARPNVARRDYDALKAELHRAGRDGAPASHRARLQGRVAWVESLNPQRGRKLRRRLELVHWR